MSGALKDKFYIAGNKRFPKPDYEKGFTFQEVIFSGSTVSITYTNKAVINITEKNFATVELYNQWVEGFKQEFE